RASNKPGFEPQLLTVTIDPDVFARIQSLVREYDTSAPVFLLACWHVLLWRLTGNPVITVGTAYDGRKDEELRDSLGLLAKYVPLQCRLEENIRFSEFLKQVNKATRDAYEWQDYFSWEDKELN